MGKAQAGKDRWASSGSDDDASSPRGSAEQKNGKAVNGQAAEVAEVGKQPDEASGLIKVDLSTALKGLQHEFGGADAETNKPQEAVAAEEEEEPGASLYNSLLQGCRSVTRYERLNKIDEGTYGVVFRAKDNETGKIVALKQVKMSREMAKEGFPITALREINIMLAIKHPNIIGVHEMVR
jgi:hypothetical protein